MPLYETKDDLVAEHEIMRKFLSFFKRREGCHFTAEKIPLGETGDLRPDFRIVLSGKTFAKVVGYVEIRRRYQTWQQIKAWGGQYIDKAKWDMLYDLTRNGFKVVLVAEFTDCLGFYDVSKTSVKDGGVRGRTDRADPDDVAAAYLINPNGFQVIEKRTAHTKSATPLTLLNC